MECMSLVMPRATGEASQRWQERYDYSLPYGSDQHLIGVLS